MALACCFKFQCQKRETFFVISFGACFKTTCACEMLGLGCISTGESAGKAIGWGVREHLPLTLFQIYAVQALVTQKITMVRKLIYPI